MTGSKKKFGARHKARKRAVDFLFEAEARDLDPVNLAAERVDLSTKDDTVAPVNPYTVTVVTGVAENLDRLDRVISDHLQDWTLDRLPAVTLATSNLASLFGFHRRLLPALLGHLAAFEMTSVVPMTRYRSAVDRLGLGELVGRFFDVHIEADDHHGALAARQLVGGPAGDLDVAEVCFGAAALSHVEDRFTRHLLRSWDRGESSLR